MIKPNIYIVDDDSAVRESLSLLVETHGFAAHLYESGDMFLNENLLTMNGPVLLDVRMPGRDGLEILKKAKAQNPKLQIIMISGHGDIPMAVRALKNGAVDFLEKPFLASDLLHILATLKDSATKAPKLTEQQETARAALANLTPRETEIVQLLVDGQPNKIIAHTLAISVRTVETHRAHIMTKLKIRSLSEMVKLSIYAT